MRRLSLAVLAGLVTAGICAGVGMGPAVAAPPTPVTCGSVITAPGQYRLAGLCGGPGITILADDVTLYLGGYLMIGPDFIGSGLTVAGSRAHVEGPGKVTGFSVGVAITGNAVRSGRFMQTRVVAIVEHPAAEDDEAKPKSRRRRRVSDDQSALL